MTRDTDRRRRHAATWFTSLLVVPVVTTVGPAATAEPRPPEDGAVLATTEPLLEARRRGLRAVRQLGEELPVAAARNELRPTELRELLTSDESAWVDREGLVYYVDPPAREAADAGRPGERVASAPLSETFALHSNPGASRTILLDFDGAYVADTAWNLQSGVTAGEHPAWDPAEDGATFTDGERALVQQVWAMVAEDYAPFDVDVTTEDPGDAGMVRSSPADTIYGTRVLVSPSDDPFLTICDRRCGGVAYLRVFDSVGSFAQPAWVFPQALGDDPKAVAEAASHEAGHNLGLDHDGTATEHYHDGHGVWAPIMGVGYYRPLVQWSRGSYPGASNQEDDLAILRGYLGERPDEAPGSRDDPAPLPSGTAVIGTPDDVDSYLLGTCAAGTPVEVSPVAVAPNLDVRAVLYDAAGTERSVAQPVSGSGDGTTASGLGAALTLPASGEGWVLAVDGGGQGDWLTGGYDDYGSLGAYTVSAPGCDDQPATVPSAPAGVSARSGDAAAAVTWSAAAANGSPVTAYHVTATPGGRTCSTTGALSCTVTGLTNGTPYTFTVRAANAVGPGAESAPSNQVTPVARSAPARMARPKVVVRGARVIVSWKAATSPGLPVTRYLVDINQGRDRTVKGSARRAVLRRLEPGRYQVRVAARNAVGTSAWSRRVRIRVR